MRTSMPLVVALLAARAVPAGETPAAPPLRPVVEAEEDVYTYTPADNGAGPTWCHGSTCLVRVGEDVFASGLETIPGAQPLNNCRWTLFRRGSGGWALQQADPAGRTREPCPLAALPGGRLMLSANPTLVPDKKSGPARPEILQFAAADPKAPFETLAPAWDGAPAFSEHSYRSFAADGTAGGLILFQNVGYTHAEWAYRGGDGRWTAKGQLKWPWGAEYEKPQPVRVCYPNVALRGRAAYFCGVSDIVEPVATWREAKKRLTGREWDYDFRRLFFTWSPDVTAQPFKEWVEIASREATCGWISPGDLWVGPDGAAHLLWTERAIDERLRKEFYPDAKQSHALRYAVVRDGRVALRRTLLEAVEGGAGEIPGRGRLHATPEGRLFACFYVNGTGADGKPVSENRMMALLPDGAAGPAVRVPLRNPMTEFFTATVRAGSPPSRVLDLLGTRSGARNTMSYARVRLW